MSKRFFYAICAMVLATTVAIVSCKKDEQGTDNLPEQSKATVYMNRIKDFQSLRDAVNSGAKTDGAMTVDEMRHVIDLTFNYEYSEHMTYCQNTVLDTFCIAMPDVDPNGNVSETDAVDLYNAFVFQLEKLILNVNDGKDVPSCFSIIMPETGSKDGYDIKVVFTRGERAENPNSSQNSLLEQSFGLDLYWGKGLGSCNGDGVSFADATDFLSRLFKFSETPPEPHYQLFMCDVSYVTYVAYDYAFDTLGWVFWEPATPPNCANNWLFVHYGDDGEPCISWDELLCYYYAINQHIVSPSGALHYSPRWHAPYFECSFDWHHLYGGLDTGTKRSVRIHSVRVKYGEYWWRNPILPL